MKKLIFILGLFISLSAFAQEQHLAELIPASGGKFALMQDKFLKGSFRIVTRITERDSIEQLRRSYQMWVKVTDDGKIYELDDIALQNTGWKAVVFGVTQAKVDSAIAANRANVIIQNASPSLTLTETANNYSTVLSKNPSKNTLILNHKVYQSGGMGSSIVLSPPTQQYGQGTDAGLPSGNNPFTISLWMKNNTFASGTGQAIVSFGNSATALSLRYFSSPKISVFQGSSVIAQFNMPNNTDYHHFIFSYNGITLSGYIDNVLIGTASITLSTVLGGDNFFLVGRGLPSSGVFNGKIDELVIWNKALTRTSGSGSTVDEIAANWNMGYCTSSPPSPGNIIRRYTFDEGGGSIATDIG